ncbi:MAG TPA: NosD domain-containing protein [Trebonia sp.]|nr:NosD domain-containing protein [Trebonia sp.]
MRTNRFVRLAAALSAPLLAAGAVVAGAGVASAGTGSHHSRTLYVSAHAKSGNGDRSCRSAAFRTIQSAVNAAAAGGSVVVCPGTYHEQVVISKPLSLKGEHATIDQAGVNPGFKVTIPGLGQQTIFAAVVMVSSKINFTGFTVRNAQGEGIIAAGLGGTVSGIVISGNAVVHNDLGGGVPPKSKYFECAAEGAVPGDCGEGVHFTGGVAYSTIRDNLIANNSGGVLLTDDVGPTHDNVVEHNVVKDNVSDCGITVPGHNANALNSAGVRQPSVAGVYRNQILDNVVTGNGVQGAGAGVLFANAGPGTASYDNLVQGNYIAGNGQSGVTMHAHTLPPGLHEDLNGNVIVKNDIGTNNLKGDTLDGPPGPAVLKTTGVLVFSGGTPVKVKIAFNRISSNSIGIWLSKPVTAAGLKTNKFRNVTTPISANN